MTTTTRDFVREYRQGIQTRDQLGLAEADTAEGTITGLAVPYDTPVELWPGFTEIIARGAVEVDEDNPPHLYWRHAEVIGAVTEHHDTDDGWHITAQVSDTSLGRDALTLTRDGVIRRLSIGFEPTEFTETTDENNNMTVTVTRALVREVSLVPHPAYAGAKIASVRHATTAPQEGSTMPDTQPPTRQAAAVTVTRADLDALREDLVDTVRAAQLATRDDNPEASHLLHQHRSYGAFIKAVAAGDDTALRAYEGVVSGDVTIDSNDPSWVGQVQRLLEARTPLTAMFNHTKDLPAYGNTVEYGALELNNLEVDVQAKEGDTLAYGKVGLQTGKTAPVITLGGWTDMSRQAIERNPYNVVDLAFRGFAIAYAQRLESLTAAAVLDAYNAQVAAGGDNVIDFGAFDADTDLDADDLIDLLVTVAERYGTSPYSADALLVSGDVFRRLAHVPEDRKALQITAAPADKVGTLAISSAEAQLSNLRVAVWPGAPTGAAAIVDRDALRIQESPGAPFRLADENITNLTKQFSVYGYAAHYAELPEGIVPIIGLGDETTEPAA